MSTMPERRPTGCAPKRCTIRGVSGVTISMIGAMGSSRTAASSGEKPEHELEVLRHEEHHAVHGEEHEHHARRCPTLKLGLRK